TETKRWCIAQAEVDTARKPGVPTDAQVEVCKLKTRTRSRGGPMRSSRRRFFRSGTRAPHRNDCLHQFVQESFRSRVLVARVGNDRLWVRHITRVSGR